jgi:hypothetical protein
MNFTDNSHTALQLEAVWDSDYGWKRKFRRSEIHLIKNKKYQELTMYFSRVEFVLIGMGSMQILYILLQLT